ncbi:hypothetical protein DOX53_10555 [Cronobacter malonaticus]|uniref:Uncharacterized protein n=1 Tax=Cronobacter malonaticus TaxID=413503 RepID=V5U3R9_9ENTR|nr:hypothetical protein P262_04807 [Cronobacter malonaticus]ALX79879.1 hypothetical protein AFK66_022965 [Cronobacter malonaticus LMG 23826]CCJ96538.1 hypothetical protein BN131_4211 [Cronobacter malonaticus 681]EGT4281226.1 hypothetical protein [Cronobacter malonaticus]EGT4289169.1 hypothetical protein [Cronobacter malonaticus]
MGFIALNYSPYQLIDATKWGVMAFNSDFPEGCWRIYEKSEVFTKTELIIHKVNYCLFVFFMI